MKNTIVLRNIKSNLVEEAIIVFKDNVKIKEKQLIKGNIENNNESNVEKVAIEEAEQVIVNYIEECEKEKNTKDQKSKLLFLKGLNIVLVILLIIAIVF